MVRQSAANEYARSQVHAASVTSSRCQARHACLSPFCLHVCCCVLPLLHANPTHNTHLNHRGKQLPATCSADLAAFLTQQQQSTTQKTPAAGADADAGAAGGSTKQQQQQSNKPFSSFLATTLMLMAELEKVMTGYCKQREGGRGGGNREQRKRGLV